MTRLAQRVLSVAILTARALTRAVTPPSQNLRGGGRAIDGKIAMASQEAKVVPPCN